MNKEDSALPRHVENESTNEYETRRARYKRDMRRGLLILGAGILGIGLTEYLSYRNTQELKTPNLIEYLIVLGGVSKTWRARKDLETLTQITIQEVKGNAITIPTENYRVE